LFVSYKISNFHNPITFLKILISNYQKRERKITKSKLRECTSAVNRDKLSDKNQDSRGTSIRKSYQLSQDTQMANASLNKQKQRHKEKANSWQQNSSPFSGNDNYLATLPY
jgi:hypothetical protein